ncbi:hypothetical protein ACEK07_04490 [Alcanivoracaceae bacterium MT1]
MATIHIHPTAASPRRITTLQERTGLIAVVSGKYARLVNPQRPTKPHQQTSTPTVDDWFGPGAA